VTTPVVPRPDNVRSDLEIVQALAARVGLADALAGDARAWKRRFLSKLEARGITLERLETEGAMRHGFVTSRVFEGRKFPTATGRANLVTEAPPLQAPTSTFPLFLMSVSTSRSQASQWADPLEGALEVTVHPDCGIADGALARLESEHGSLEVCVRHDANQRRDVALVPKGGRVRDGRCANTLIGARLSDHGEGAALCERVRLVSV
jgi:hypothetical protein